MHYASTLHFQLDNHAFAVGTQTAVAQEIDKCGTVITAPGDYTVDRTLYSTSPTEDCIAIQSSGVSLIIGENSTALSRSRGGVGVPMNDYESHDGERLRWPSLAGAATLSHQTIPESTMDQAFDIAVRRARLRGSSFPSMRGGSRCGPA
jgi:hypothetical protein